MTYAQPAANTTNSGRVLTILGFVFGAIAVLFLPIIFGPAGIICSGIAMSKGDRLARWALVVSIVGMIIGFALSAAVLSANN